VGNGGQRHPFVPPSSFFPLSLSGAHNEGCPIRRNGPRCFWLPVGFLFPFFFPFSPPSLLPPLWTSVICPRSANERSPLTLVPFCFLFPLFFPPPPKKQHSRDYQKKEANPPGLCLHLLPLLFFFFSPPLGRGASTHFRIWIFPKFIIAWVLVFPACPPFFFSPPPFLPPLSPFSSFSGVGSGCAAAIIKGHSTETGLF